ncbi:acyltransferase [Waltera sp.]|jgi:acetyltransferase-like isoleucine patch superfamily enzyme|uniref:acyltransferase n=1 Tax=Waltera sp. TaxID=2815806 RepID=UPI0011E5D363
MKEMLNLFNRIIDKWLRFYRAKSFEAYTGKKAKNLSILGKVYLRNKNVIVGENVTLYPGVMFQGEGEIYIGNNTFLGNNTIVYSEKGYKVSIGADCMIAAMCHIINTDHKIASVECAMNQQGTVSENISIEDNVWLASAVTVLKGVNIKRGSVIGAKAVVNKSTEENGVYVGIPAKLLKNRK